MSQDALSTARATTESNNPSLQENTEQTSIRMDTSEEKTPRKAWLILAVVYLASFVAPMTQFKIPPLSSWLIPAFSMDGVTFGYLMSALAIIGMILAFPASLICRKYGLKSTMIVSLVSLIIGNLICTLAPTYIVMCIGRLIEGFGISMIGVAAPSCVAVWFPEKTRGLALGIWASWVPLGITFMFNCAPSVAISFGWKTVFWICTIVAVIALIIFVIAFTLPDGKTDEELDSTSIKGSFGLLKNPHIWILGGVFFAFNFIMLAVYNSHYNTFLETMGWSSVDAASITSIMTVVSIVGVPIAGAISDKVGFKKSKYIIALGMLFLGISVLIAWHPEVPGVLIAFTLVAAIGGSLCGGACRPVAPIIIGGGAAGATMAMGVLEFSRNLAQAIGAPLFGWGYETMGWETAGFCILLPVAIIGLVLSFFVIPKKDKKSK